mmetsp:Transcript_22938/g.26154  ORF Transcript_22938/g.26154 Transcript_22938/m.26154 type:complete len:576 (+) Transcript_22938:131-1858(+)
MATSSPIHATNRVQRELQDLRKSKKVANESSKLKDTATPLNTPEEAEKFLASLRSKEKSSSFLGNPPANLSANGMNAWHLEQRQREKEMRLRRKEAEEMLRKYRMTMSHSKIIVEADEKSHKDFGSGKHLFSGDESFGILPNSTDFQHNYQPSTRSNISGINEDETLNTSREEAESTAKEESDANKKEAEPTAEEDALAEEPKDFTTPFKRKLLLSPVVAEGSIDPVLESEENTVTSVPFEMPPNIQWREFVEPGDDVRFPAAQGRYHLYASYACPGSHRALIVRALKGLEDVVDVTIVHPIWRLTKTGTDEEQRGWVFSDPEDEPFKNTAGRGGPFPPDFEGTSPDPFSSDHSIRDIYEKAGDTTGKFTVPLLWDTVENTIVNNESSDIAYMFNSSFNEFAENPSLDLYPEEKNDELNDVIEWLLPLMIHGFYRCGFAKKQELYDKALTEIETAFDRAATVLEKQRYLTGDKITDADLRLFVSLFRFDEIYYVYFRANSRKVLLTPSLLNFCREIYQLDGVSKTCSIEHCKSHFFCSHAEWNKFSIIPRGIGFLASLEKPHNRGDPVNHPDNES